MQLFQVSLSETILSFDQEIAKTIQECDGDADIKSVVWEIYKCFINNKNALLATFRAFMSQGVEFPDPPIQVNEYVGPPGGIHLMKRLEVLYPDISHSARLWGVHYLFSHLFHISLLQASPFGEQQLAHLPFFEEGFKQRSLSVFVDAIVAKIQDDSVDWDSIECKL
jgi:hypothetical protein